MLQQTVKDYIAQTDARIFAAQPQGDSASPKQIIFHILPDPSQAVEVLDIGFGTGQLGQLIKSNPATSHWSIDGVDGWDVNCHNSALFEKKVYRNIWHGLAQELPAERLAGYKIICLLDVIEHLNAETARSLIRTLLESMGNDSFLFVSTPLWFYPQDQQQDGDLEEHLIGVPASSMLAMIPKMYSISHPLIGGFVYGKNSLQFADFFQPTEDRNFSFQMGMEILRCMNVNYQPGVLYSYG